MISVVSYLKETRNSLIGNPTAKLALQREGVVNTIVEYVNITPDMADNLGESLTEIRTEAAQVIASLAHGSPETLHSLLTANAHEAIIWALSELQVSDPLALKTALVRSLRALAISYADINGPSLWGMRDENMELRSDIQAALDDIFQTQAMDIYLPLLGDASPPTKLAICQLLASAVRIVEHRSAVSEWVPVADRVREQKGKRGWEKPNLAKVNSLSSLGGWVSRSLTAMIRSKNPKLQEASLLALASLAKDNPEASAILSKIPTGSGGSSALSAAVELSKSRDTDIQIAACLCGTRILRADDSSHHSVDSTAASWTLLHVLNGIMSNPHESSALRTKACFVLYALVTDHKALCRAAFDTGSLGKLSELIKAITTADVAQDWTDGEPESICQLREAAMTTLSALTFFDDDIRREVTGKLGLVPAISVCLLHPRVGVRFAACQCVRAISRSVAVLRTNIADADIGIKILKMIKNKEEDRRVTNAALTCICNLVNDFSPLRTGLLHHGLVTRLAELFQEPSFKKNAFWAVKNLLYRCPSTEIEVVMNGFGWNTLAAALTDPDVVIQEQALNVMCNITNNATDVETLFKNLCADQVMTGLSIALESPNDNVLREGIRTLNNIANRDPFHKQRILSNPHILKSLRSCLTHSVLEIRQAAAACVKQLARGSLSHQHKELRDAGIDITLRHIIAGSGARGVMASSPSAGHQMGIEEDDQVRYAAQAALHSLEHPESSGL